MVTLPNIDIWTMDSGFNLIGVNDKINRTVWAWSGAPNRLSMYGNANGTIVNGAITLSNIQFVKPKISNYSLWFFATEYGGLQNVSIQISVIAGTPAWLGLDMLWNETFSSSVKYVVPRITAHIYDRGDNLVNGSAVLNRKIAVNSTTMDVRGTAQQNVQNGRAIFDQIELHSVAQGDHLMEFSSSGLTCSSFWVNVTQGGAVALKLTAFPTVQFQSAVVVHLIPVTVVALDAGGSFTTVTPTDPDCDLTSL